MHAMMASIRRVRLLADGALASPPTTPPTAIQRSADMSADNLISLEHRLKHLKRANRDLTDFADSVARGLRTPLDQILNGATQLSTLAIILTNPVSLGMTEEILTGANQMQGLVNDYLSFANAERHTIYRCRISLESVIQLVRHELEPMCGDRKITWKIAPLPEVEADVSMLRQVLVNLLTNSIKYTYKCPEAVIEIGVQADTSEHIIFIRDNGIGFDLESASNLFQKFGRLHNDGALPGAGIGLVIVKHIIQRHQGRVWAEAAPGGGATFYFTLPA
jgi:signal transduction histidine kinase